MNTELETLIALDLLLLIAESEPELLERQSVETYLIDSELPTPKEFPLLFRISINSEMPYSFNNQMYLVKEYIKYLEAKL